MRAVLRRIGARTGISLGLVAVIVVVVVVARLLDDERAPSGRPGSVDATPSVAATEGDDGPIEETPEAPTDDAAVLAGATAFTSAWLDRTLPADQWLAGLRPHATDELVERLTGVDPLSVPESATLGTPTIRDQSAAYAEVVIGIGPGDSLVLGMVNVDDRWVVATLDQETG